MRVLIVDDNREIRSLVRRLLESMTSATVVAEVGDGDQAADAVARSEPDVVIMDYRMARVDGVEASLIAFIHELG